MVRETENGLEEECFEVYEDQPQPRKEKERCDVKLPESETQLAVVYTLMHEGTGPGYIGQAKYNPGDKFGHATGTPITYLDLVNEGLAILAAIWNYSLSTHQSLLQAILDDNYMISEEFKTARASYEFGKRLVRRALNEEIGGLWCLKLEIAVSVSYFWDNPEILDILPPGIKWWRAIIQGKWVRPGDDAYARFAYTDFLDHNPT